MADQFKTYSDTVFSPARKLLAITPHDNNEISSIPKGLLIGGAGTISIVAVDDTDAISITVVAGQILPIRAKIVKATGTTATGIVALL